MKLRLVIVDPQPRECAAGAKRAGEISEGDALALGYVADEDFTALDRFEWDMDARYGVEAWRGLWVRLEGVINETA